MTFSISSSYSAIQQTLDSVSNDPLPSPESLAKATASIHSSLPVTGLGEEATATHLIQDLTPGFNGPKTSSNYYGFVTGGVLPIAEVADNMVTAFDQNVQVHLPDQSISTIVEDKALSMLAELVHLDSFTGRTFTTGATASNILGLACGRQHVISQKLRARGSFSSAAELGILEACIEAGITKIQVLTAMAHSSTYKAASLVGIGRSNVRDIGLKEQPWRIDINVVERELKRDGVATIVFITAGEVNTGRFTADNHEMKKLRDLCDAHGSWLHVDGAFGLFATALPQDPQFSSLREITSQICLAHSIAGDGHKMLNVPYDCGFFFTEKSSTLSEILQNPNAPYLSSGPSMIPSPLNIRIENSCRFRALPVYAALLAYGQEGFSRIFALQVLLARSIAEFLDNHDGYEFLTHQKHGSESEHQHGSVHMIVLFRAKDDKVNEELTKRINATRKMYVSGTKWEGKPACRIAISTWKVDLQRDLKTVTEVLQRVLQ
ncbi:pyridoxal phosphate-dependent transferase [Xylogone sp. PMI_703]|nr:pyridoxal phosphate-dependent transferase [Xylogone sp. PMI_703]